MDARLAQVTLPASGSMPWNCVQVRRLVGQCDGVSFLRTRNLATTDSVTRAAVAEFLPPLPSLTDDDQHSLRVASNVHIVTSLPDYSEFADDMSLEDWKLWFRDAAVDCLRFVAPDACAIFYQTDMITSQGIRISKASLLFDAAKIAEANLVWHKVACRVPVGRGAAGSPGYSHMMCFSKTMREDPTWALQDVMPDRGDVSWPRGTGANAAMLCCEFIRRSTSRGSGVVSDGITPQVQAAEEEVPPASGVPASAVRRSGGGPIGVIVDPFCGQGAILAAANANGFDAVGIDLSWKRARRALMARMGREGDLVFEGDRHPGGGLAATEAVVAACA